MFVSMSARNVKLVPKKSILAHIGRQRNSFCSQQMAFDSNVIHNRKKTQKNGEMRAGLIGFPRCLLELMTNDVHSSKIFSFQDNQTANQVLMQNVF